jgi:hypothetical protein
MPMSPEMCRHLAELAAADDRLRAEHADWEDRREPRAYTRKSGQRRDLLYRETDNASLSAPATDGAPSYEEDGFNQTQIDALAYVINELRREFAQELNRLEQRLLHVSLRMAVPAENAERQLFVLKDRFARLEGFIERQFSADRGVIDLPANFLSHDRATQ